MGPVPHHTGRGKKMLKYPLGIGIIDETIQPMHKLPHGGLCFFASCVEFRREADQFLLDGNEFNKSPYPFTQIFV